MVLKAVDEGRAVHPPRAGAEEDELAEEWSPEELSSAALLASSVLAKFGTGQVSSLQHRLNESHGAISGTRDAERSASASCQQNQRVSYSRPGAGPRVAAGNQMPQPQAYRDCHTGYQRACERIHRPEMQHPVQATSGRGAKLLQMVKLLSPKLANITMPADGVPVEVLAILDPLSKTAQKVAPVLDFLRKTLGIGLKVSRR